jgi:3-methyladenine DNA glycosylase Mpg
MIVAVVPIYGLLSEANTAVLLRALISESPANIQRARRKSHLLFAGPAKPTLILSIRCKNCIFSWAGAAYCAWAREFVGSLHES